MRQLTIDCKKGQFRVRGTGRWADFGDSWLCAHDIVHHTPADRGSVAEEVATFGAEMWLESYRNLDTFNVSPGQLAGVLRDIAKADEEGVPPRFFLNAAPETAHALPEELVYGINDFALLGMYRLTHELTRRAETPAQASDLEPMLQKLKAPENVACYGSWMVYGYLRAQQRWPDARQADQMFDALFNYFETARGFDGVLKLDLDEVACTFTPANRNAKKLFRAPVEEPADTL